MLPAPALEGRWLIARDLLDRATGQRGSFAGSLVVSADTEGFGWQEAGMLRWDGRSYPAERTLALRCRDGQWWLTFVDGRPFHRWVVGEQVTHPCAADTYRGLIEASEPDAFTITWDVTGPTKDHLIASRLTRVST